MRKMLQNLASLSRRFHSAERGSVGIIFGMSLLPMIAFVGASIDYSRGLAARTHYNGAADAAALNAVRDWVQSGGSAPSQAKITQYFIGATGSNFETTVPQVSVSTTSSPTSVSATVSYTVIVPTAFIGIVGINTMLVGGTATAVVSLPRYATFNFLLDNSPSMGLGATAADITLLENLTAAQLGAGNSCAFACHEHTFDNASPPRITGNKPNDNYTIAKLGGVKTRIDVLRDATKKIAAAAVQAQQMTNQFKMSLYTFSDTFQTISAPTTSLTAGSPNIVTLADNVDLAFSYKDQRDAQTSFDTGLSYINTAMTSPGDGSTAGTPLQYLFIVTDGVQDEPAGSGSGAGNPADVNAPVSTYVPPNVVTQANMANGKSGNVNSKRLLNTPDASLCSTIKTRGIKIAVLHTPYLPVPSNGFYNQWVAPLQPAIQSTLTSCASPGLFFQVTPTQGIDQAMVAMFSQVLSQARLTQ